MGSLRIRRREPAHESEPLFVWNNPGKLVARNGCVINTATQIWRLPGTAGVLCLNWANVTTAPDINNTLKAYLAHIIEAKEFGTAKTTFDHLKHVICELLTLNSLEELHPATLEGALEKLRRNGTAWKFGYVRRWYRWCNDQNIAGFNDETEKCLYQCKISPNSSGHAVMTRDPERGPFSDQEHWLIRLSLKEGKGSLLDRVCIGLLLELGSRPLQLILLEEQDFRVTNGFYSLNVPRVKQQTVGPHVRKRRRISEQLGQSILSLIKENHEKFGDYGPEMPILCGYRSKTSEEVKTLNLEKIPHMTRDSFKNMVVAFARKAGILSPHTGKILNLFPYRFRYTFGTRHAEQGTPKTIIAELLDHDTEVSANVYIKSTNNMVDRLNTALGNNPDYTSVISRFLGQVTLRSGDQAPHTIINGTTPTLKNLGGIGACGADFLCKLMPPLSCYICPKFQAWTDGPHKEMLEEVEDYDRQLMARTGNPSDRIPQQLTEVKTAIRTLLVMLEGARK